MKVLEDNAKREQSIELPLQVRCPHCDSLLLIEYGDCRKRYSWAYTIINGGCKKCCHYVIDCPCCKEEFILRDYENI